MRKRIFYHYKLVSSSKWNTFIPDTMRKIDPKEYMQDGWDSAPGTVHPYVRGSLHNKIGMWIMWTYYVLIVGMVIRLIWALNT